MTYPKLKQSDIPEETINKMTEFFMETSIPRIVAEQKEELEDAQ